MTTLQFTKGHYFCLGCGKRTVFSKRICSDCKMVPGRVARITKTLIERANKLSRSQS